MNNIITFHDRTKSASIFDNNRFKIYKNTNKNYTIKEVHSVIGRFVRYMLEICKVIDNIKTQLFELDKLIAGFTSEQKD